MLEDLNRNQKNAHIGSVSVDLNNQTAKWTAETYNILGYDAKRTKPTLQKYIARIHSDEKQWVVGEMEDAIKTGTQYIIEHRIIKATGDIKYVSIIGIPEITEENRSGKMLLIIQDITKQKQQEEELTRYKKAIESSNEAIALTNIDGEITFINKAFEKLFEYSAAELVGETATKLYPNQNLVDQITKSLLKGKNWEGEAELVSKRKQEILINLQVSAITNEKNEVLGFNAVHNDIREQKEAERIRENELVRQRITLQIAKLGTWYIDFSIDGEKIFIDRDLSKIQGEVFPIGINYLHFRNEWVPNLLNADPANGTKVVQSAYEYMANPEVFSWFAEYQYIRPVDNKKIWLRTKAAIRRNQEGKPIYIHGVTQDITIQKNNELEILSSQKLLKTQIRINEHLVKSGYDFLEYALDEAVALSDSNIGYFYYYDEEKQEFTLNSWSKEAMKECRVMKKQTKYQLENTGLWGEVVRQRKPIIVNEYNLQHPYTKGTPEGHVALERYMSVPIFSENKIVAVAGVANKAADYNILDQQQLSLTMDTVWKKLEKYKADQELKKSREKIQRILETAPIAVAIVDTNKSTILLANDAANKLFAINKHEINKYDTSKVWLNSEDRDEFMTELSHTKKHFTEKRIKRLGNSEEFWASISAVVFNYGETPAVLITVVDMSEHKKLQFQLQEAQRAADSIVDTMPIPTAVTTIKTGAILRANTAMAEFHGVEISEFAKMKAQDWYVNPNHRQTIIDKLNKKDFVVEEPVEMYRYKTKEKRNVILSFVKLAYNNVDAIVGSIIDITKIQEAQDELEKAKKQAEVANLAKSAFLANMSHEIRTPMNAILGYTEVLKNMVKDNEQKMYLDSMFASSKVLLSLINDILDLSKIEAGKMLLNYETISTKHFVSEIEIMFKERARQKGLNLTCNYADNFPQTFVTDELRLRQVAINLIGNAIKFTKEGYVNFYLKAKDIQDESFTLIMEIEDTGIGINKEKISEIFEDFEQEDGSITRNYGGTGLGLGISKRIANLLKGELKVKSQINKGSVFTLEIPKVKYSEKAVIREELNQYNPDEIKFEKAKILVVDDIETNRNMLQAHLKQFGFKVYIAENGAQALEQASKLLPDIIFMDLRMPEMDGYTAAAKLKAKAETAKIPVIACSASAINLNERDSSNLDFAGFLQKPLLLNDIVNELCKLLKWEKLDGKKKIESEVKNLTTVEIKELKQKTKEIWDKLDNKRTTKLSKQFADSLISHGKQMNNNWITSKGKELQQAINSFNVELTKLIINEFKELFK